MSHLLILLSSLVFLNGSSAAGISDLLNDVNQSFKFLQLSLGTPLKLLNSALDNANEKSKFVPVKRVITEVSDGSEVITIIQAPHSLSHVVRPNRYYPVEGKLNVNRNPRPQVYANTAVSPNYNLVPKIGVRMRDANDVALKGNRDKGLLKPLADGLTKGPTLYLPNRNLNPGIATLQAPSLAKVPVSSFPGAPPKAGAHRNPAAVYSPITGWLNG